MADGSAPAVGDRVLVMRQPWLDLVLSGEKTLQLRPTRHALGRVWLGMGGKVYGGVTIAGSRVLSEAEFHEFANQHLWPRDAALPYERRVCGLALTAPRREHTFVFQEKACDCSDKTHKRSGEHS